MTFFLLLSAGEESTISSQPLTVNYVVNLTVMVPGAFKYLFGIWEEGKVCGEHSLQTAFSSTSLLARRVL